MGIKPLGIFELNIMMALTNLGPQAYGVSIWQNLSDRLERDVAIGAVYATLERLEKKGFVKSRQGESTPLRGGRAKKYFEITATGQIAKNQSLTDIDRLRSMSSVGGLARA